MSRLTWDLPRGFALQAASEFYGGFTPGAGMAVADEGRLTLAFRLDRTFEAVAVELKEEGQQLVATFAGTTDGAAVQRQVTRMLGLDVDAAAWLAIGERDPVVGKLQAEFSGFFTAAKSSPWDAAVWGIIAQRISIKQAAKVKIAIGVKHGDAVELAGKVHHVFPSPRQLLTLPEFQGLPDAKLVRLKGIARAALEGKLDPDRLRALDEAQALEELQQLPGVGPWTASHILYRGAALTDALPTAEPRVLHGLGEAYGLKSPTAADFQRLGEGWRPFRMWVCILLARHLGRAGGWNRPELFRERAAAGRALTRKSRRAH